MQAAFEMWKKGIRKAGQMLIYLLLGLVLLAGLARLYTGLYSFHLTYTLEAVPMRRVAIIFGAGLSRDGGPSLVLKDRVETGAKLYFAGKVEKLLMTGDNRFIEYNEPEAMRQYALSLGVPDAAIVLDYAGRRTYDSCYRAKAIFGLKEAILVTQQFHLARALFLCNSLGLDGVGVEADNYRFFFTNKLFWNMREIPATLTAFADMLTRPEPVLGDFEPIFSEKSQ